ncbi:hypothetical protein RHGRI_025581 [Rhododendron griersonianum]|uniref:Uncharacterized protein n=1 Tax=Rhododendron griersonianum TaxID=479676 RepID=A0AAV6IPT5_9ERIC|nr:hypothetical protein RHGRI_025581 [Rhododendron griersonianum]
MDLAPLSLSPHRAPPSPPPSAPPAHRHRRNPIQSPPPPSLPPSTGPPTTVPSSTASSTYIKAPVDLVSSSGRCGQEHLSRDLGTAPDDEGIELGDLLAQLLRRHAVEALDFAKAAKEVETAFSTCMAVSPRL